MRGHSCAQVALCTRLSPDDGDEGRDLHGPALLLLHSLVRVVTGRCSQQGAGWLRRRSFCSRTLPFLIVDFRVGVANGRRCGHADSRGTGSVIIGAAHEGPKLCCSDRHEKQFPPSYVPTTPPFALGQHQVIPATLSRVYLFAMVSLADGRIFFDPA